MENNYRNQSGSRRDWDNENDRTGRGYNEERSTYRGNMNRDSERGYQSGSNYGQNDYKSYQGNQGNYGGYSGGGYTGSEYGRGRNTGYQGGSQSGWGQEST